MTRHVFVNGSILPYEQASISIMDRGFLFADGVYEVSAVLDGRLVDNDAHLARLIRSLGEISIRSPFSTQQWTGFQQELIEKDALVEGIVYMQVTRGVAERDFVFPKEDKPTTVMFTQQKNIVASPLAATGAAVVTVPDLRWKRRDIKSVALLPQVLAKQHASMAGANEAFMVENGHVTEGGSSTAFIVTHDNVVVTRPLSNDILPGITRQAILALAEQGLVRIEERPFTVEEMLAAAEVFFTSASTFVTPVVSVDGRQIGDGRPGPRTLALREAYISIARAGSATH